MALLSCLRCTTKFATGLLRCPHCLSEKFEEDGVPKITTSGGASHPEDLAAVSGLPVPPAAEPAPVAPAAGVVSPPPAPEPAEPEVAAGPEPAVLKADLQDQARELGLPVSGTKAQLAGAVAAAAEPAPKPKPAPSLSASKAGDG
jgi:hypothetical protein